MLNQAFFLLTTEDFQCRPGPDLSFPVLFKTPNFVQASSVHYLLFITFFSSSRNSAHLADSEIPFLLMRSGWIKNSQSKKKKPQTFLLETVYLLPGAWVGEHLDQLDSFIYYLQGTQKLLQISFHNSVKCWILYKSVSVGFHTPSGVLDRFG